MIYIKVKQNGNWKNLLGPDYSIFKGYTILTPDMVSGIPGVNSQRYIGTATHLIIDNSFPTNSLDSLFKDNQTLKSLVILTDRFIIMESIFYNIGSQFESLFMNTSKVTNMATMFMSSLATTLDVSSFDTSKVTNMSNMFESSKATTLDLSSFDTSNVADTSFMFANSQATTGYARTQADANKFNASMGKPAGLTFVVKP